MPTNPYVSMYQRLQNAEEQKLNESLEQQRQGIAASEAQLKAFKAAPAPIDLSALAQLTDTWTGSNLARGYERPMNQQERQALAMKLEQGIQGQKKGLTDAQIDLLRTKLSGQLGLAKIGAQEAKQEKGARLPVSAVSTISEGQSVVGDVDSLLPLIDQNQKLMGPVKGFEAFNPYSEEQRNLQASFDRIKQTVGKLMEGGVLRKEDEAKYMKILPHIRDTPAVARHKAQQLKEKLSGDVSRYQQNLGKAGYDVSGFGAGTSPAANSLSPEDEEDLIWAKENRGNPVAEAWLSKHGMD